MERPRPDINALLFRRYGEVPRPTPGEEMFHDLPIDIGRLPEPKIGLVNLRQEIRDVLALAEIAKRTEDDLTAKVALERWNSMFPNDQYKSTSLLLDVEGAEEDDDL